MEYANGGNLRTKINEKRAQGGYWTEEKVMGWFFQVCMGVKYLHDKKIAHKGLKPQNLFLQKSGKVMIKPDAFEFEQEMGV